ncbi:MAG TPA: EAL domain-containing response regulator [Polyangia bacterium]|nr:EAL domain-containing response regulator [Polyangia bacterium]
MDAKAGLAQDSLSPEGKPRPLVLVVDDDEDFARSCVRVLQTWGYGVQTASDGGTAIELARSQQFDVVLTDIQLPSYSGLDILRAVRERDRDTPVVLMTGGPGLDSARVAVEWGALSYLVKPLSMSQLRDVLSRAVQMHRVARRERRILNCTEEHEREMEAMRLRFDRALAGMWTAFQPIVSWSRKSVVAYEALMRTTDTELSSPMEILKTAEALDEMSTLGRKTRGLVADVLRKHPELPGVFVNLHVLDLADEDLYSPHAPLSEFASRIHLEITERMALERIPDIRERVAHLRRLGFRIAVDDLGEGYSGLNSFAQLEPDVVKLDMTLIRGIDTTPTKRKMVHALMSLCLELETPLVAEGVETEAERNILVDLGADLFQGYLFAKPGAPFPVPRI